jgi:hypothetical protein
MDKTIIETAIAKLDFSLYKTTTEKADKHNRMVDDANNAWHRYLNVNSDSENELVKNALNIDYLCLRKRALQEFLNVKNELRKDLRKYLLAYAKRVAEKLNDIVEVTMQLGYDKETATEMYLTEFDNIGRNSTFEVRIKNEQQKLSELNKQAITEIPIIEKMLNELGIG